MRSKINYQHVPLATAKRAINGPDGISITQRGITSGFRCDTAKAAAIAGLGKTGVQVVALPPQLFPRSRTDLRRECSTSLGRLRLLNQPHNKVMADPPGTLKQQFDA